MISVGFGWCQNFPKFKPYCTQILDGRRIISGCVCISKNENNTSFNESVLIFWQTLFGCPTGIPCHNRLAIPPAYCLPTTMLPTKYTEQLWKLKVVGWWYLDGFAHESFSGKNRTHKFFIGILSAETKFSDGTFVFKLKVLVNSNW